MSSVDNSTPGGSVQHTRERILKAAEDVFRQYGYQKTTVADIAARLNMSPANIYRFFPSKNAINQALAALMLAEVETGVEAVIARAEPAGDRLINLVLYLHDQTVERYMDQLKVHEMVEVAIHEKWSVVDAHIERIETALLRLIQDGIAQGDFPSQDAALVARLVHGAMAATNHPQLVSHCLSREGREQMRLSAGMTGAFLVHALKAGFTADKPA